MLNFVKEPYASQLKVLGLVVIKAEVQCAEYAAQEAIRILNSLVKSTLCESHREMLLRLIATYSGASHPNRASFERNQMRIRLGISSD